MKRIRMISMLGLIIWLCLANLVFAGDNLSIPISCTIPAIPGVNVPLIEEETFKTKTDTPQQPKVESQQETQPQTPAMIQEDTQGEMVISEDQKSLIIVKTIYSR